MYDRAATDAGREGCVRRVTAPALPDYSIAQRPNLRRGGFRVTETVRPVVFRTEIPPDTEEGGAEPSARPPSTLALLLSWRNWNIPTKLTAVTLVPVVFAIVLGAMHIAGQVAQAQSYRQVDRLVAVSNQLRPLIGALQQERTATTTLLAAGPANPAGGTELAEAQQSVDV